MANLIKYLPDIYKEFYDYQKMFEAENPEFDLFYQASDKVDNNFFPQTADGKGLGYFEDLLDITPLPTDSLEDRRYRVIARLNQRFPYTEIQLRRMLAELLGWDGYTLTIEDLHAIVNLTEGNNAKLKSLREMLQDVIPMNMIIDVERVVERMQHIRLYSWLEQDATIEILPYQKRNLNFNFQENIYAGSQMARQITIKPYGLNLEQNTFLRLASASQILLIINIGSSS